MTSPDGLYIAMFTIHGLVRGDDMELGRDADTGGQVKYVIELARALAEEERVARVDVFTRLVEDAKVDASYAEERETLAPGADLIRLRCGPRRYLRKEVLWPHLHSFIDEALRYFRSQARLPDVLHGHYADAGLVAAKLCASLGVPMVFTGHSLGREKQRRLLDKGMKAESIEKQFHISTRIEAEEIALDNASLVIASTSQEVDDQYAVYHNYHPERMEVTPPGVDLERFRKSRRLEVGRTDIQGEIDRFLENPKKPLILAVSRADPRKNIAALVKAYGQSKELQELANLAVVAGSRDDIHAMDREPREVLLELLYLIDRYDLYGKVAYPKTHGSDDIPALYRLAARRRGVFVNPALTEPFGLTLLEAAASGLPVVATNDGGPREILARCKNGVLVDPLDVDDITRRLRWSLEDRETWKKRASAGASGVRKHYSWRAHAQSYLSSLRKHGLITKKARKLVKTMGNKLVTSENVLITDIDNTLIGDRAATDRLLRVLRSNSSELGFGVATGRTLESAVEVLQKWRVPRPDVLITGVGSEIAYGPSLKPDDSWSEHIDYRWNAERIREVLGEREDLEPQPESEQLRHKISYYIDEDAPPSLRDLRALLRKKGLYANLILSHGRYLDVLPVRASKGRAVRYLLMRWGLDARHLLVAGDSGNDEEMLAGDTLAVVVANHSEELAKLEGREKIYFSKETYADGLLDGLAHYGLIPEEAQPDLEKKGA